MAGPTISTRWRQSQYRSLRSFNEKKKEERGRGWRHDVVGSMKIMSEWYISTSYLISSSHIAFWPHPPEATTCSPSETRCVFAPGYLTWLWWSEDALELPSQLTTLWTDSQMSRFRLAHRAAFISTTKFLRVCWWKSREAKQQKTFLYTFDSIYIYKKDAVVVIWQKRRS